jgi:predicted  nucleic acid-binding Zn-ribbon protein
MGDSYETTVTLRHEGDVTVDDRRRPGIALGPAADALEHDSVLREIRKELGFEGTLTGLADWIDYETEYRTGTMSFTVSGETGEDAAEYARVVTNVFMDYHKERQSRRLDAKIARTGKRIEAAEKEAENARDLYNAFREMHGIADLSTEQQSMVKSAASLRADSELAVSEIRALEAQVRSLEAQLASTPKTSFVAGGTSPERATYNRLRQELASARATLSPEHPRVQALQQQVGQLRSQLRAGGNMSSGGDGLVGVNTTYQVVEGQLRESQSNLAALRERKKGLDTMADRAHNRVEAFSGIEGEATALLAEVKVTETLLGGLRSTEATLEDVLNDPPSGFVVLDPGAVPEYPAENKMKMVVFLAIPMLFVAVVLIVVLRREFQGLWVTTPAEVAFWGNGPVLATTSWPNDPQGLGELIAGLDDLVPDAKGSLLIVGGSSNESRIANELADRLNDDWFPTDEYTATPSAAKSPPTQRAPLQTPPPSGPYPIGDSGTHSVALARLPSAPPGEAIRLASPAAHLRLEAWDGPYEGQALRRAARIADRIVVLVRSGAMSAIQLHGIQNRVGRQRGIGYIVVGLSDEFRGLPDRVGDVAGFWRS